jgi:hypothetical protein
MEQEPNQIVKEIEAQRQKMGISGEKKEWKRTDQYGRPLPGGRKLKTKKHKGKKRTSKRTMKKVRRS